MPRKVDDKLIKVTITLRESLVKRLDAQRGDISRTAYLKRALQNFLPLDTQNHHLLSTAPSNKNE